MPSGFTVTQYLRGGVFLLIVILATSTIGKTPATPRHTPVAEVTASYQVTSTPTPYISPTPTVKPRLALAPTAQAVAEPEKKVIKYGDKGSDVTALQNRLAELGYLSFGDVDGVFGDKTRNAMLEFQSAAKLPKTGECDHDNYVKLIAADAPGAQNKSDSTVYVYVTPSGSKYHNTWCPTLQRDAVEIKKVTEEWAIANGYEKCRAKGDW